MPHTSYPRLISVAFAGITLADDFGLGNVNVTYSINKDPHGNTSNAASYVSNTTVNGVLVMVSASLSTDGNWVNYDITKESDLNNTQHVFDANGPVQGYIISNSITANGGTATIST